MADDGGKARLVRADGTVRVDPGPSDLDAALSGQQPFWLDLTDLSADQADWLGRALGVHPLVIPGAGDDQLPYLRDIHDHLRKLSGLTDSYRDLIVATAQSYVSVVSNQQNQVMKQLAVIATIFLPLTFLTGFFGQNFGSLVNHVGSWAAFLILGIGTEVAGVAVLYLLFWRRGWLRS
jgi:magnesium transporter